MTNKKIEPKKLEIEILRSDGDRHMDFELSSVLSGFEWVGTW